MDLRKKLKSFPALPGIYLFYNRKKALIYIGKATNLKSRVRSYFTGQKSPRPIEELLHEVSNIKFQTTDSVLEAIILEANSIKKFQPKYNVLGKDDKSWNYLGLTNNKFPALQSIRQHDLNNTPILRNKYSAVFGPFPGLKTEPALKILRRLFNYSTCKPNQTRPCFYYQINQCLGVCTGEITSTEYKRKVIKPLTLFLDGQKTQLLRKLTKEMLLASRAEQFEEAARIREQIKNLTKIQDVTLINKSFFEQPKIAPIRIEGYDISNLGATGKVGSLVVFNQFGPIKSDYKKFKIKTVTGQSDVDCLAEVINRRLNHEEWPLPDLFLIDGGKPQVNRVAKIFKARKVQAPILGIAKGPSRKKNEFIASSRSLEEIISKNKTLLLAVRDEAHRFAIKYQRSLRKIK